MSRRLVAINGCEVDHPLHEVRGSGLPDDRGHIGPLLGNDELKLVLDARGCMHDYTPPPPWPPPRIVWTGRRHNQRIDRYNSNQFEYGFFDVRLADEDALPAATGWRQRLHPRDGFVETEIRRGRTIERVTTFLCLDRNLIACRRQYEGLPSGVRPLLRATYVFCQIGADRIPFRTTWSPGDPDETGITARFTADGHRVYTGQIALFAGCRCVSRAIANRLALDIPLGEDGAGIMFLAMEDDLGDDPQLMTVHEGDWMPKGVRDVHRENEEKARTRCPPDFAGRLAAMRAHAVKSGFETLLANQRAAWNEYVSRYHVTLPDSEPLLAAAVRGAIYHVRCGYSHYCWGSSPFNQSWGAHYAWNERYPVEGLMAWGVDDMPVRVMEWRRRILPFLSMRAAARGAFYHHSSVEPGTSTGERNATNFYELFVPGIIANYLDLWYRYTGDEAVLRRYYPVIRECAEFYRYWLLIELPGNNLMTVPLIDVSEHLYPVEDGPFTICSAARLFDLAVRRAEQLGEDAPLLPVWCRYRDMAIHLVRHLMGRSVANRVYPVWTCYQDFELDTVPEPSLTVDSAVEAWRDENRNRAAVDQMKTAGQNVSGDCSKPRNWPWGAFQQAYFKASLGQPDEAGAALDRAFKVLLPFGGQCESAEEDFSRADHPWFTTASGALLRAVARMFLFPQDDDVRLFPGVPRSWSDFSVEVPAHGGLTVSAEVKAGRLVRLALFAKRPQSGRTVRILIPRHWAAAAAPLKAGLQWSEPAENSDWREVLVPLDAADGWISVVG
jgi:hypothetical protein